MAQKPALRHVLGDVRLKAGLSQLELSKLLGCSGITVQRIEQSTLPLSIDLASKVEEELDVSAAWLLANDPRVPAMTPRRTLWTKDLYEFAQGSRSKVQEEAVDGTERSITARLYGMALEGGEDQFIAWRLAEYTSRIHAMLEGTRSVPKQGILVHRLGKMLDSLAIDFPRDKATLKRYEPKIKKLWKAYDRISKQNSDQEHERLWRNDADKSKK